jgi:hypothetical protein
MLNPFLILKVPLDATDEQVRVAYRTALQANPPEGDPVKFQEVQEAWKLLGDERSRWKCRLFQPYSAPEGPLAALTAYCQLPGGLQPLGPQPLREWLRACVASPSASVGPASAQAVSPFANRSAQPKKKKKR